jgi:hypothetical protein
MRDVLVAVVAIPLGILAVPSIPVTAGPQSPPQYRLLDTLRTGTMQKELQAAAATGWSRGRGAGC